MRASLLLIVILFFASTTTLQTRKCSDFPLKSPVDFGSISKEMKILTETLANCSKMPGFSISLVDCSGSELTFSGGIADAKGTPVTPLTIFSVGSVSKAFTAAAIGRLGEMGILPNSFDTSLQDVAPSFKMYDTSAQGVTFADFLSHRSGYGDHMFDFSWFLSQSDFFTPIEYAFRIARFVPPAVPFRSTAQYSNIGVNVAGSVAAYSWKETNPSTMLQELVFTPLGLTHSGTGVSSDPLIAQPFVPGYGWFDASVANNSLLSIPAGGVYTNAQDLSVWLRTQLGLIPFFESLQTLDTMHQVHMGLTTPFFSQPFNGTGPPVSIAVDGLGLGWVIQTYRGTRIILHAGDVVGFGAYIALLPEYGVGIAFQTNTQGVNNLLGLAVQHFADLVSGRTPWMTAADMCHSFHQSMPVEVSKESTVPAFPGTDYDGNYSHPIFGNLTVEGLSLRYSALSGKLILKEDKLYVLGTVENFPPSFLLNMTVFFERDEWNHITTCKLPLAKCKGEIVCGLPGDEFVTFTNSLWVPQPFSQPYPSQMASHHYGPNNFCAERLQ